MNFEGYQSIFGASEAQLQSLDPARAHQAFREEIDGQHPFHFATAVGAQMDGPDFEALGIAVATNPRLCVDYLERKKSTRGYVDLTRYRPCDVVDSRHIMMSTIIFNTLGRNVGNIVEIGGGFGNWLRLNETVIDFQKWSIIDMPFVTDLQRWYLSEELQEPNKLELVPLNKYPIWNAQCYEHDLVLGAHSLSEFAWPVFLDYFESVLTKSKFVFYATHLRLPSPELVEMKLKKIETRFERIQTVPSEGGAVANILYRRLP